MYFIHHPNVVMFNTKDEANVFKQEIKVIYDCCPLYCAL